MARLYLPRILGDGPAERETDDKAKGRFFDLKSEAGCRDVMHLVDERLMSWFKVYDDQVCSGITL
jgi:hypothetical protein